MPGNVAAASVSETLPWSLCKTFGHSRAWLIRANDYRNGESQRLPMVQTSRKQWQIVKRLTPTELDTLRDFYDARGGPHEPFYFYDPWETDPKFDSTPSGGSGRYVVRFDSPWDQFVEAARAEVSISLVELA
jgi:phage-related protein